VFFEVSTAFATNLRLSNLVEISLPEKQCRLCSKGLLGVSAEYNISTVPGDRSNTIDLGNREILAAYICSRAVHLSLIEAERLQSGWCSK